MQEINQNIYGISILCIMNTRRTESYKIVLNWQILIGLYNRCSCRQVLLSSKDVLICVLSSPCIVNLIDLLSLAPEILEVFIQNFLVV